MIRKVYQKSAPFSFCWYCSPNFATRHHAKNPSLEYFCCIWQADCNKTITIVEGGPEEKITFTFQRNPKDICDNEANCKVYVDIIEETGKEPK